jgi:tRNA A-37 threonylcarbamoyl transferase component Bud32
MTNPKYTVESVSFNDEPHVEMGVRVNGRRFHIDCRPSDLRKPGQSTPSKFELEMRSLCQSIDDSVVDDAAMESAEGSFHDTEFDSEQSGDNEEFVEGSCEHPKCGEDPLETWALQPFLEQSIFNTFAPEASNPLLSTLHDCIHTPTLSFTLKVVNERLTPVQVPTKPNIRDRYARAADISSCRFWRECPVVKPENVPMLDKAHPQNRNLIIFQGKKCWFKPISIDIDNMVYEREVDTLRRIERAGLYGKIRVPKLNALVVSQVEHSIYGMVLDYVSDTGSLWDRRNDAPVGLRKGWYDEVARMLRLLHAADIVWGDVKPENMLLDEQDDIWLIDFGGGFTYGWVGSEKMETKEGDLQGLAKFKAFLKLN